jgi:hypothetical protein
VLALAESGRVVRRGTAERRGLAERRTA